MTLKGIRASGILRTPASKGLSLPPRLPVHLQALGHRFLWMLFAPLGAPCAPVSSLHRSLEFQQRVSV